MLTPKKQTLGRQCLDFGFRPICDIQQSEFIA